MNNIGLVFHPLNQKAQVEVQRLSRYLEAEHRNYWVSSSWEVGEIAAHLPGTELIVTAGGDGTILRVARLAAEAGVPILGINMGRLGFMTELTAEDAAQKLPAVLAGEGWLDERSMLQAEVRLSADGETREFHALNDVVVARVEIARIIHITMAIDGQEVATYRSDGLVVATATGSTGYALAAGGPVLHPQADALVLVPIAAHLSMRYPLVLPADVKVKLVVSAFNPATVSIDGHVNLPLGDGSVISLGASPFKARFLRLRPGNYFFSSLQHKLKG